jgi:hypothetical protein
MERDSLFAADGSPAPIFAEGFAEAKPVPKFHPGQAEVVEDLLLVSRMVLCTGIEFHNPACLSTSKSAQNRSSNLRPSCSIEMGT